MNKMGMSILFSKPVMRYSKSWLLQHKIETLVTAAIILDWLPYQIFGDGRLITSGTKFVALPLILLDFLRHPNSYQRVNYAWFYGAALIVGVGGGVLTGVNEFKSTLWALLPNILILMYYLKHRSWERINWILRVALWSSVFLPVWLLLVKLGFLEPEILIKTSEFSRFFAGANRSSLGLLIAFIPATFGGLMLTLPHMKQPIIRPAVFILLSAVGALLTGQRSANLVIFISLGLAMIIQLRHANIRQITKNILIVGILVAVVLVFWDTFFNTASRAFILRIQGYGEATVNTEIRIAMYRFFLQDLWSSPSLIGPGKHIAYTNLGVGMHFLVGEAYYIGGLLFSCVIVIGIILSGYRLMTKWVKSSDPMAYNVLSVLLILFVAFLIVESTHAGLNVRVVYMLLGLWLSAGKMDRYRLARSRRREAIVHG